MRVSSCNWSWMVLQYLIPNFLSEEKKKHENCNISTLKQNSPEEKFQSSEDYLPNCSTNLWNSLYNKDLNRINQSFRESLTWNVHKKVPWGRVQLQHQQWRGKMALQSQPTCIRSMVNDQFLDILLQHHPLKSSTAKCSHNRVICFYCFTNIYIYIYEERCIIVLRIYHYS